MYRMEKTVFLDRDGVLNEDIIDAYITTPEKLTLHSGVLPGLRELDRSGFRLIIISNQAGIGDRVYQPKALEEVTEKLLRLLASGGIKPAAIYYCLHGKTEGCGCRKPASGLLRLAAQDFRIDRKNSFLVGDKLSDMAAGREFGVKTVLVLTGHGAMEVKKIRSERPDFIVPDFSQAVEAIFETERKLCRT